MLKREKKELDIMTVTSWH